MGSVTLRITESTPGPTTPDALHLTFDVIDTGIGIATEDHAVVFEPFQRLEANQPQEGSGLGLAIAKGLIELMGGQIGLESEQGAGSRFFFTIPFAPATSGVMPRGDTVNRQIVRLADGYAVSVLIADDVQENCDVLSKILRDIGCDVPHGGERETPYASS